MFQTFDEDNSGTIEKEELFNFMKTVIENEKNKEDSDDVKETPPISASLSDWL